MQFSIKHNDYGSLRCIFSEKANFLIIIGQKYEITTAKKPETRTKADFLSERANILSKKPALKIGSKYKKRPIFETNPDIHYWKIATFWGKGGTINLCITFLQI